LALSKARGFVPTPGFVVAAVLALIVAAVCVRLGFWQLDRLQARRAVNAAVARASALPELELDSVTYARILLDPGPFVHRIASVQGRFDSRHELLLRGRSYQGRPGVHLITPLRLDSVRTILVNRGWLPAPDAATADPRPHRLERPVHLRGSLQWVPELAESEAAVPLTLADTTIDSFRRLDRTEREQAMGTRLPRVYLQLLPSDSATGPPIPVPEPELSEGPHLGYAIQWFSFAAIAVIGLFVVAATRARRTGDFRSR
jgi:surfeit locus 1 family protein